MKRATEPRSRPWLGALHLSKDTWAALTENADKGQATWLELFDACDDVARD